MALLTFAVTLFVSAFLLFLVQPIIGQKILPKLGGTPSVWNTCVVFFQCTLLIGYAYTHFTTRMPVRRQILIHCALLFVPFLILLPSPFSVENFKPVTGGDPTFYTLGLLAVIVGIPFFVVSTTAPLLQKWFGSTGHPAAKDPYFLYGASNLGSMLSLVMYPFVFEPVFGLDSQSWFYTIGYILLVAMVAGCGAMAFMAPPTVALPGKKMEEQPEHVPAMQPEPPPVNDIAQGLAPSAPQITEAPSTAVSSGPPPASPPKPTTATGIKKGGKKGKGRDRDLAKAAPATAVAPAATAAAIAAAAATPSIAVKSTSSVADKDEITWLRRLRWIGLAAVPSSLMLGVTTYMSTDISAIPLFWVLPLALYLLSFILVFMRWPIHWLDQAHEIVLYAQPIALAVLALMLVIGNASIIVWMIFAMILAFTLTCLACHGEMAKDRPSAKHLTEFYLLMSVGGAIGGLFNGILAPVIFKDFGIVEFGLALAVAGLLRPAMKDMGWTEMLMAGMGQSGETGKHHGKGGKKITKSADSAGLTLTLDFVLPIAVLALLGLSLAIFTPGRGEGGTETLFYAFIVPVIITACFFARPLRFGIALAGILLFSGMYLQSGAVLFQTRSYFGVLRVRAGEELYGESKIPYTNLTHGTTHHGMCLQSTKSGDKGYDLSRVATTYYHRQGPVGICMDRFNWFTTEYVGEVTDPATNKRYNWTLTDINNRSDWRMPGSLIGLGVPPFGFSLPTNMLVGTWSEPPYAVIGMGTATMATYARPFQTCHFYEIDEQIKLLSLPTSGKPYFGYVTDAHKRGANVQIMMGDARLRMAMPWVPEDASVKDKPSWEISEKNFNLRGGPEYFYHLMVVDAFSSDAIPRHLITKQALEMYFRHLKQGHWGEWVEVDPKDETRDINGEKIDVSRLYDSERKPHDGKVFKRWWYPGGMLCVHTSNRHLELVPVVRDTSGVVEWDNQYDADKSGKADKKVTGLVAWRTHDNAPGHSNKVISKNQKEDIGHFTSEWVIIARDDKDLKHLKTPTKYKEWVEAAFSDKDRRRSETTYWTRQHPTGTYVWTDDHSNLMAVFRWPWSRHD